MTRDREPEKVVVQEASARLEQLIAKWRREAADEQRVSFCADDLEAILPALQASETQRHALTEGLRDARQFLDPAIPRGPDVNGWANTVENVDALLASSGCHEGDGQNETA